jgi:hypothetical protein
VTGCESHSTGIDTTHIAVATKRLAAEISTVACVRPSKRRAVPDRKSTLANSTVART